MTQFITRAYNNIQLNPLSKATLIKSSKELRLKDEIEYYQNIPIDLSVYYPRIISSSYQEGLYNMEMEYYAYDNLGNLMVSGEATPETWDKIFDFLFTYLDRCKQHKVERSDFDDSHLMYIEKTENEYSKLINNFSFFKDLSKQDYIYLNNRKLKNFHIIWPKIKNYITQHCFTKNFNVIHGDLCFSNILYGKNSNNNEVVLKFIDPRGSFGNIKVYGDQYYDLAKIKHSCQRGYEYLITDNFTINQQGEYIFNLTYSNNNLQPINDKFSEYIINYNYDQTKIDILQGTIYIGMCARHYDSFTRQKAMLLIGLEILNDVYEKL
jgi:hypothetical protein